MENNQISFFEKRKTYARPYEHVIRIVIRVLCVLALAIAAFSNWPWYVIIAFGALLGISFLEAKKDVSNRVQIMFQDDILVIEKSDLVNSFGLRTKEIYTFEYKTKPAVEYSTRDHTVTFRGNASVQYFKFTNKDEPITKLRKTVDGPITLVVSAHGFDGDIVHLIHENSPLRVEKISC